MNHFREFPPLPKEGLVQILHPFAGSIQQYAEEIADPDRYRPNQCPQCQAQHSLTAHGFYSRTLVDAGFDGSIRVRRYLCRSCKRTVSLLPEFALPYLRFSVSGLSLFLVARLLAGGTLAAAAVACADRHALSVQQLLGVGAVAEGRFLELHRRAHLYLCVAIRFDRRLPDRLFRRHRTEVFG